MYEKITKLAEKFEKVAADPWDKERELQIQDLGYTPRGYQYLWWHYDRLDSAMDELRSKLSSRSNDDAEMRAAVKKIQDEANKLSAKFEYWEGSRGRDVEAAALAAVKKTAVTFDGRVAQMFKEGHQQVAGHEPSDVRVAIPDPLLSGVTAISLDIGSR